MKKLLILLLIILSINLYSRENLNNTFLMDFVIKPDFKNEDILRGASISWNINIIEQWYVGLGLRLLHSSYSSLYGATGTDLNLNTNFSLPIEVGYGVGANSLEIIEDDSDSDLLYFIHFKSGIDWKIDQFWSYYLHLTYNYNFNGDEDHSLFGAIGVKYNF